MTTEEILLEKWRTLPSEKQQEVLEFVDTLAKKEADLHIKEAASHETVNFQPKTELGKKLWELRQKAIAAGKVKFLDWDGIEQEIAQRRGEIE
ncbi:hypothetical protein [Chroococcus sp. FPU101]|uniref:hypothetical protein n=1 Tax=Chroococcus sp. FPU101 TaxID=1974212 RepID=UPI001A8F4C03|nr:hypothetical protein [Chroococcus sp. FPU101]GFE67692.1 hypothetical protein CFPU101_03020 [Chroococcus sp. FPU101]